MKIDFPVKEKGLKQMNGDVMIISRKRDVMNRVSAKPVRTGWAEMGEIW